MEGGKEEDLKFENELKILRIKKNMGEKKRMIKNKEKKKKKKI